MPCDIIPVKAFQSTNLNSKINTFADIADRILRSMGAPLVKIEATSDMIFENISIATELFTKFAGYTQEYLVFDTKLYEPGMGVRLDNLLTQVEERRLSVAAFARDLQYVDNHYTFLEDVDVSVFAAIPVLAPIFPKGAQKGDVVSTHKMDATKSIVTFRGVETMAVELLFGDFVITVSQNDATVADKILKVAAEQVTIEGSPAGNAGTKYKYFDYDIMNYRKVMSVTDFRSTGDSYVFLSDNLNSIGGLMAQPGMANSLGQHGFDLVSFHMVKDWMETREKVLQTRVQWKFDDRTQYMRLYPQPTRNYIALCECYVEKPLRDIVKEPWVQQYALALTKIQVANVRGKIQNLSLLGGGSINYQDIMSQGIKEKEELEKRLYEGASAGLGDAAPPRFFLR